MKRQLLRLFATIFLFQSILTIAYCGENPVNSVSRERSSIQAKGAVVTEKAFHAEYFAPQGTSKKLAVLVLGGSDGGIPSRRARWLSENGFHALALAYFKTDRTPAYLDMIPLEYFDSPILWLRQRLGEQGGFLLVMGESKGAELALLLASKKPEISGVVAYVPSFVVFQGMPKSLSPPRSSWSYMGAGVPFVPYDFNHLSDPDNILSIYRNSLKQTASVRRAMIPVDKINGPILLFSAQNDQVWPSAEMSEAIIRSLDDKHFKYYCRHINYENAGHTMSEYYMMGGTEQGNRKARIDSAEKTIKFLNNISSGTLLSVGGRE